MNSLLLDDGERGLDRAVFIGFLPQDFLTVAQLIQETAGLNLFPEPRLDLFSVRVRASEGL